MGQTTACRLAVSAISLFMVAGCDDPAENSAEQFAAIRGILAPDSSTSPSRAGDWIQGEHEAMLRLAEAMCRKVDLADAITAMTEYIGSLDALQRSDLPPKFRDATETYIKQVRLFRDYLADTPKWRDTWGGQAVWVLEDTVGSVHVWVRFILPAGLSLELTTEGRRLREGYEARLLAAREAWATVETIAAQPE